MRGLVRSTAPDDRHVGVPRRRPDSYHTSDSTSCLYDDGRRFGRSDGPTPRRINAHRASVSRAFSSLTGICLVLRGLSVHISRGVLPCPGRSATLAYTALTPSRNGYPLRTSLPRQSPWAGPNPDRRISAHVVNDAADFMCGPSLECSKWTWDVPRPCDAKPGNLS